jgi:hypothetical protein
MRRRFLLAWPISLLAAWYAARAKADVRPNSNAAKRGGSMADKFAERGAVGSGDGIAALAIVRNLMAVLVATDKINLYEVDWALRMADAEVGAANTDGHQEARRLVADFRSWIVDWKQSR